ncbi:hypothetical protein K505DRAFT_327763 [Melanomma pulvis-pyrius CBS 109.77]|uniref:Uncharacterized protein n=1 Tax=Melanomma pulvis-pyrius CBS 109.77 TaxID=1314802 RepID=A0A6A6X2K4_9PLEO|nr:hypothetical protein K505DRAFT_327763 [Melanomma pulvis-pyrius CBS 109.77]
MRLTGCSLYTETTDEGQNIQVAECTNAFLTCHAFNWYGVPETVSAPMCFKAKVARWCMFGCTLLSFIIFMIHARRCWRRRKWTKRHGIKDGVSISTWNAEEKTARTWVPT